MNKTKAQIIHAKRRAKQRFNINLSKEDYDELIRLIHENKAEMLYKESLRISIKKIDYQNQVLYFVYDNKRHTIVTFLYKEYVDWQAVKDYAKQIERMQEISVSLNYRNWDELKNSIKKYK